MDDANVKIKPPPRLCTPQQRKFLMQRLNQCRAPQYWVSWRDDNNDKHMPKHIRAAKRAVLNWEKAQQKIKDVRKERFHDAHTNAKNAILFMAPETALEAVEFFEAMCRAELRQRRT